MLAGLDSPLQNDKKRNKLASEEPSSSILLFLRADTNPILDGISPAVLTTLAY